MSAEPYDPVRCQLMPVEPLRSAFLESGLTAYTVALRAGWMESKRHGWKPVPDSNRVLRTLGLRAYVPGPGYPSRCRERISTGTFTTLARAMDLDFGEFGL